MIDEAKLAQIEQLDVFDPAQDQELIRLIDGLDQETLDEALKRAGFDPALAGIEAQQIGAIVAACKTPMQIRQAFDQLKLNRKAGAQ